MPEDRPFVERSFTQGSDTVRCTFFQPVSHAQDYSCRFEIAWPDGAVERTVWGVDAVQALLLAMRSAHDALRLKAQAQGLPLTWFDSLALGLPPRSDTGPDWAGGSDAGYYALFLGHLSNVAAEAAAAAYSREGAELLRRAEDIFREECRERHPELWDE
ncbi:MAG: DUF6968 family protein [Allosphingosinicella sp.]|uniref:DUF6968 family protein n=1 Tax=Allosphingosinicella sp. TaxID=2823234 RepID=UPI003963E470